MNFVGVVWGERLAMFMILAGLLAILVGVVWFVLKVIQAIWRGEVGFRPPIKSKDF